MVFCDKEVKLEVAPRELHAARDGCPLAESDGLVLGSAIGQCVAADDILLQHILEAFFIAACTALFANLVNHFGKQPLTTSVGVVGQDVNAIAGAYGNQALELPFRLGFDVLQKGEFAAQNLDKEIPIAAGRIGEHLAMVSHPLAAFDLFCVFVLYGHKKIVELCLCSLGCSTTRTINK